MKIKQQIEDKATFNMETINQNDIIKNDSSAVSIRFFQAIARLKESGELGGIRPFCERYGINVRNCYLQQSTPSRQILRPAWLQYLVRDYGVSAEWLLNGSGPFYRESPERAQKRAKIVNEIEGLLREVL